MGKSDADYEWLCSSDSHVPARYALAAWSALPWQTHSRELPPVPPSLVEWCYKWERRGGAAELDSEETGNNWKSR